VRRAASRKAAGLAGSSNRERTLSFMVDMICVFEEEEEEAEEEEE
jgi:hypothetical protein